jgi:site-specific recombinase XerD
MTKEEIWKILAEEVKLRGMSQGTCKTYKCLMNVFLDWANKPYEELGEDDFRKFLVHLHYETNIKPATINSYNGAVRFLLVVILGKDINYRRTARIRHVGSYPDIWSKEEIERFFSVIDNPRDLAIFVNIYGSGLRVSEISNLKIQDVDSKSMRLFLRQAKGNKDRYTILSSRGLEALRRYWKIFKPVNPQNWVFPGTTKAGNLGTSGIEIAFKKYKKKAGITTPGTVHTLRHCFASHALEDGVEPIYIKSLLGHTSYSSTNIYLHVSKTKMYQIDSPVDRMNQ